MPAKARTQPFVKERTKPATKVAQCCWNRPILSDTAACTACRRARGVCACVLGGGVSPVVRRRGALYIAPAKQPPTSASSFRPCSRPPVVACVSWKATSWRSTAARYCARRRLDYGVCVHRGGGGEQEAHTHAGTLQALCVHSAGALQALCRRAPRAAPGGWT